MNEYLHLLRPAALAKLTHRREGETKLGEEMATIGDLADIKQVKAPFVLMGIEEDIGIRANFGQPGARDAWDYGLSSLANMQSHSFLSGNQILALGSLRFEQWQDEAAQLNPENRKELQALRELTKRLDKVVQDVVHQIKSSGKIPIIIGGGHNNALPIIAGVSRALNRSLPVLNMDPHTDFRALEGRHSGNGFRYAREQKFLGRYGVYGLHEAYNSASVLAIFHEDPDLHYLSHEQFLFQTPEERQLELMNLVNWLGPELGLEVDLDSLSNFPVSAYNPAGFTLNELRTSLCWICRSRRPHYLHLAEASPGRAESTLERAGIGKTLAYLITDFIKASTT